MNKINKFGMLFVYCYVPDFGGIEPALSGHNVILLSEDIPKLNSTLTAAVCEPYLTGINSFSFRTGDTAFIIDWLTAETASMYMYYSDTDTWYEIVPNE